jgi:aryl-phospho-beta-D-glucosidase BglC (GH1 family)
VSMSQVQLLGVNLSGAEDGNPVTGVMGHDYIYPTTSEIDYFASLGLNVIRVPVAWQRIQPTEDGPLSTTQLGQLETLVTYAATKGIKVDIDLHNYGAGYGADVGTSQTPDAAFANFWGQMAAYFKSAPNVIFGLMNEPNTIAPAAWAVAAQDAVTAIRATGASQEILVSGSDWDTASSWVSSGNAATVGVITDPDNNMAFEVHQYFDQGSTGTTTSVLSPSIGPQSLASITQWAEANGKKLFLGEFGAASDPASLTALGNTLNYLTTNAGVWQGGTYWAGGPWMNNYMFSANPENGVEAPQTAVLAAAAATTPTIAIYAATAPVTANAAGATPFSGVIINGASPTQNTTVTVTLSSTVNGALSDPNALTDGSQVANGVWTMSGSSAAVAAALDGLVFTPTAKLVGSGGTVTTTATAVVADAGETASTTSLLITGSTLPISITPATTRIATTDAATAKPFSGVAITDVNAGQVETATVTLSVAANGTLSDPNTSTDGSGIAGGVWSVHGSSAAVAAALDGLVFTPALHQVTPGGSVATTVTAAIEDTFGEAAVATSVITATAKAVSISISPATEAVATTNTTCTKPFSGIVITDANAGQTETATVRSSTAANGTLSDPNAAADSSTIAIGVWTVSGSPTTVAAALDGLVFTPSANPLPGSAPVVTTLGVTVKDTAGEMAFAASTVNATAAPVIDTIVLNLAEDQADGDAEFTVSVNGLQVGGDYQAHALHASGDAGSVTLTGEWGSGVNDVEVSFINHTYGRNLYVDSISENGTTYAGTSAAFPRNSTETFAVGGATPTASTPADNLTINLSEDAWQGNADFVLYIDGKAVTTPQVVSALHDANATQGFSFTGDLGAGTHTVGIGFTNDAYGGSASADRNLYINGITLNGSDVFNGLKAQYSNGISTFSVATTH